MSDHWLTLGNTPSTALQDQWGKIAALYNTQLLGSRQKPASNITVIPAETGTGKTQGLGLYCSMLPKLDGVLIVTRTNKQADEIATIINDFSNKEIAVARHGDNEISVENMRTYQILAVTHSRYGIALENSIENNPESLDNLLLWSEGKRKLTVVDEAPDFIKTTKLTLDNLTKALGNIPSHIRRQFPTTMTALHLMLDQLEAASLKAEQDKNHNQIIRRDALDNKKDYNTMKLCNALRSSESFDSKLAKKNTIRSLKAAQTIANGWCLYLPEGIVDSFNTTHSFLPVDLSNVVVLDATAAFNPIYKLFPAFDIPALPKVRCYSNVKLHVARVEGTGKGVMFEKREKRADLLSTYMRDYFSHDKSVFICCHKDVEPSLLGYEVPLKELSVDHWGNIDGRNTWQEFDTAILYGLPFLPSNWAAMIHAEAKGLPEGNSIYGQSDKTTKRYKRRLQHMADGKMTTSIIQAINRVKCRRVIDGEGNCSPTDVYILLPKGRIGDQLLTNIKAGMPAIRQVEWQINIGSPEKRARKSRHEETLISYLSNLVSREIAANLVRSQIGASTRTWARILSKLKDDTSDLYKTLKDLGVILMNSGKGRGSKTYFVKLD